MKLTAAQLDRACGVLLGSAVGDALGAGYEFVNIPDDLVPAMIGGGLGHFAPGEWTDDTSMMWAIADVAATGADLRNTDALDAIARRFADWYETGPADVGINTSAVLREAGPSPTAAVMTAAARERHAATGRTGSNGSLMRTAPVALSYLDDPEALVDAAMRVSALTHSDPDAQAGCALWSLAIRHAVLTGEFDLQSGVAYMDEAVRATWLKRIAEAESKTPAHFKRNGGAVVALQAAWAAIVQTPLPENDHPCRHFADSVATAIRIGHDTDTVAAIAGALLGARWGMSAIPAAWRRILHGYPGIAGRELEWLAVLAANGGQPIKYGWPLVDHIDYIPLEYGKPALAPHPHDPGVWLSSASTLNALPDGADAVVSLCLTGRAQVPPGMEHINFRLMDEPDPARNPNLDFVLTDAARTIAALRAEGKTVLVHCVAAHSRTPTVGVAYAMLRGVPFERAMDEVCGALPAAHHMNSGFRKALQRLRESL
jgi:ADP-ribosylglycohydrolase/protein-tyrosine phosphatase